MSKEKSAISVFQRYLTVWVIICMAIGVLIGKFLPQIPDFLNRFEYVKVSIPMAILIWLMIYPMMMKVDFQSIKNVGKNPKGLFVTWITNWLIKPFTMYGIASLFFFVVFKAFITPDLATEYLAGAVLLGAAPCTAMVFVWSSLTKGDPAYTVVQVATNDLIMRSLNITHSFSRAHVPYDNSVMESFFASIKREELYRTKYRSEADFRSAVDKYIVFYNTKRPHKKLQYKTPEQKEEEYALKDAVL